MRERLMTAENSAIENGHIVIRDRRGVIRLTSNSEEDRQAPFDVNGVRLAGIQRLILHRYDGGPCNRDSDVHMYLSAAFNAIALGLRLKRRKASPGHFKNWAARWCPVAHPHDVADLAARVAARPRRMKASTFGRLLGLSSAEHAALSIEAIYPADDDTFEARKKREKAEQDRAAKEHKRRVAGRRPLQEIVAQSDRTFCCQHKISYRTFKYNKAKGPEALAQFLQKRGVTGMLPHDGAPTDGGNPLMRRHSGATLKDRAGGGRQASRPATSGLVIQIDSDWLDRALDKAETDRRQAASRAAAASGARLMECVVESLRSARKAA